MAQTIISQNYTDNGHTIKAGEVIWQGTSLADAVSASQNGYVYLYNVKTGKFLNTGGAYGVQGTLSSVGMRVKVTSTSQNVNGRTRTGYTIEGRVDNPGQGSFMSPNGSTSSEIYMDRRGTYRTDKYYSEPIWSFSTNGAGSTSASVKVINQENGEEETKTLTITSYIITNVTRNNTAGANSNDAVLFSSDNNVWRFVSEEDYKKAMDNVTWGQVDLGSFVQDAEFSRDSKDARYWVWSTNGEGSTPSPILTGTDSEGETITLDTYSYAERTSGGNKYGYAVNNYDTNQNTNPTHWHQRNQDLMCNAYVFDDQYRNSISGATIGRINGSTVGNTDHDNFRNAYAKYYAAEIYNEKIMLSQEIHMDGVENLKEGLYKVTAQAFYYDDVNGTTNQLSTDEDKAVAYFFVNSTTDGVTKPQATPLKTMSSENFNITPHSGVSAGSIFDNHPTAYQIEFYVEVKKNTTLTIGMRMDEAKGWAVIGNIHFWAHGKQALFLDEDWNENTSVPYYNETTGVQEWSEGNPYLFTSFLDAYDFPATVYYNRTLTKDKWNPICLPISLTADQIHAAFGENAKVSEFVGMDSKDASLIKFKKVDLDKSGTIMETGKPYIIKPTRDPDLREGEQQIEVGNGGHTHYATVQAPVYYIGGVTKTSTRESGKLPELIPVTCPNTGLTFVGNYYARTLKGTVSGGNDIYGSSNPNGQYNYWVITMGKMYHLTGANDYNLWGTYAYIYDKDGIFKTASAGAKAQNLRISIDGIEEDIVTAIEGLHIENVTNYDVYNMSGQKVAENAQLDALPKGVYIVNGKKYVVK